MVKKVDCPQTRLCQQCCLGSSNIDNKTENKFCTKSDAILNYILA